ncbi:MAG: 3-oxoacid CoA-transferase subunit A, partial [bacterium]
TIISNDTERSETGIINLISHGRVSKFIGSYIGINPILGKKMNSGEIQVELVPQGTFAERLRAKGAGLGGVLTPTGIATEIEKGKEKLTVDGKEYLLEKPLGADFAVVKANICDRYGNAFMAKSSKNFNPVMAMAADYTMLETEKIVEPGELDPEKITLPGVFVDAIVLNHHG